MADDAPPIVVADGLANPVLMPPNHTVRDALVACGVDDVDLFQGQTKAQDWQPTSSTMTSRHAWTRQ